MLRSARTRSTTRSLQTRWKPSLGFSDVRVFNLSFDSEPLSLLQTQPVKLRERLILAQELDNFIFEYDVIMVVAAGNSEMGISPNSPYPQHYSDARWHLGAFARTFNSLTCGAYVSQLSASGLVKQIGWPSPLCRVGPGLGNAPKPDFSASGGNVNANYAPAPGLGVWGLDATGTWVRIRYVLCGTASCTRGCSCNEKS